MSTVENTPVEVVEEEVSVVAKAESQFDAAVISFTNKGGMACRVRPQDVSKELKSGAQVFVAKKEFREQYELTSSEANKHYAEMKAKFGKLWGIMARAQVEVDESILIKSQEKELRDGTIRKTMVFESKPVVEKEVDLSSMSVDEILAKLGDKAGDVVKAAMAKKALEA